ncbi:PucR family transcriptional regulator [Paenarthrobacter sp. NPDC092416]|uniref:PucR family transcriptional regulator n=1 Tax=Paenarthrobacter sp. NPDC092416 TaxID=3364386 RepID=UPI003807164E
MGVAKGMSVRTMERHKPLFELNATSSKALKMTRQGKQVTLSREASVRLPLSQGGAGIEVYAGGTRRHGFGWRTDRTEVGQTLDQFPSAKTDLGPLELAAFNKLNDEFIRLLLSGASHISLAEVLAHHLGCPVIIENALHEVLAYAGGTSELDKLVQCWSPPESTRHNHDGATKDWLLSSFPHEIACARRTITLRGEEWGWLHVVQTRHTDRAEETTGAFALALARTAEVIAITLQGDLNNGLQSTQRQKSLLTRLMLGDINGEQFVERALRIGQDLRDRPLVAVAARPQHSHEVHPLETLLRTLRTPFVQAVCEDHHLAVVALACQSSVALFADELARAGIRAGVSRLTSADHLASAIRQSRTAAIIGRKPGWTDVVLFDRLGIFRLLVALHESGELERYVDDELGPILLHDESSPNALLPTLRAYLAVGGNKAKAAEALFVQRRSLYYRLERIDSLLERSLEDPETRTVLDIALRGWDYLQTSNIQ